MMDIDQLGMSQDDAQKQRLLLAGGSAGRRLRFGQVQDLQVLAVRSLGGSARGRIAVAIGLEVSSEIIIVPTCQGQ